MTLACYSALEIVGVIIIINISITNDLLARIHQNTLHYDEHLPDCSHPCDLRTSSETYK